MAEQVEAGKADVSTISGRTRRRAVLAATVGTFVEFFDLFAYGAVAIYIGQVFFPPSDPTTQLLASYAVFGLTFVARPIGGIFFGPLADSVGRRRVLYIVLTLMTFATLCVGLLPTYDAVGFLAPVLLIALRCLQNFSAGGEYGSGSTFLLEFAQPGKKALSTSFCNVAVLLSFMVGIAIVAGLESIVSSEGMVAWGWRIPFLVAAPLGLIGVYIRRKFEDTPEFVELRAAGDVAKTPLKDSLQHRRQLLTTIGIGALHSSGFFILLTFMISYVSRTVGFGAVTAYGAVLIAGVIALVVVPLLGSLADRIGARKILIASSISWIVLAVPAFALIRSGPTGAFFGVALLGLLLGSVASVSVYAMTSVFPTRVRSSGTSLAYTLQTAVFGGLAPFIATFLVGFTGSTLAPAFYVVFTASLCLIASLALRTADSVEEDYAV